MRQTYQNPSHLPYVYYLAIHCVPPYLVTVVRCLFCNPSPRARICSHYRRAWAPFWTLDAAANLRDSIPNYTSRVHRSTVLDFGLLRCSSTSSRHERRSAHPPEIYGGSVGESRRLGTSTSSARQDGSSKLILNRWGRASHNVF